MTEKVTRAWLDLNYPHKVRLGVTRMLEGEHWECGSRFDNAIGVMRVRVLDLGGGEFGVEIAQNVIGAANEWASGICVPVELVSEVRALVDAVLCRNRIGG